MTFAVFLECSEFCCHFESKLLEPFSWKNNSSNTIIGIFISAAVDSIWVVSSKIHHNFGKASGHQDFNEQEYTFHLMSEWAKNDDSARWQAWELKIFTYFWEPTLASYGN